MKKLHLLISAIIIGMTALLAVSCEEEPQIVKVESIEITNADPMELKVDETATLDIKVLPEKATNPKFTVSVKDPNIASVSGEYVVTALAAGSTTITATTEDGGHTATITVNVTEDTPEPPTPEPMTFDIEATQSTEYEDEWNIVITPSDVERYYIPFTITGSLLEDYAEGGVITEPTVEAFAEYFSTAYLMAWEEYKDEYTLAEFVEIMLSDGGTKGVYDFTTLSEIGKNYALAFTLDAECKVEGLEYIMYLDKQESKPELMTFGLEVVETKATDIIVNIDAPDGLPLDDYGDPIQYIVRWAPVSEIGNLTDEELFQKELDQFAADYAEYADMVWWSYTSSVMSYAMWYGDQTEGSLKTLSSQVQCPIEQNTEYEIYVYAVEIDEDNKTCSLLTEIARERATTKEIAMKNMSFTFGYDRVVEDAFGLSAYFSVTPDNNNYDQTYVFYAFHDYQLMYMIENFTEMNADVARQVLQSYIDSNNSPWYPTDPSEWVQQGYGYSDQYSAATVTEDPAENLWYIVAAAVDAEYNICSEPQWELKDVSGLVSTDDQMNLTVTNNNDGSYTATVTPKGTCEINGYIFMEATRTEAIAYLDELGIWYDKDEDDDIVKYYIRYKVQEGLDEQLANGGSLQGAVMMYLKFDENAQYMSTASKTITPAEDTYVIAYTLYERSGAVNGLTYEVLTPGAAEPAAITVADFLAKEVSDNTWYQLTGTITNVSNTTYGNFDLVDETGSIYVYGLTATKVDSNDQSFSTLGLKAGDIVTLIGTRAEYNGNAQVGGPAYYVSHIEGEEPEVPADSPYVSNINITSVSEGNASKDYAHRANIDGAEYDVLKLGTGSVAGSYTTPALGKSGDMELSMYAVAWKGKKCDLTITINGGGTIEGAASTTFNPAANDGASGNSPYTITVSDTDLYKFNVSGLTESSTITFSTSTENPRCIIFGANLK